MHSRFKLFSDPVHGFVSVPKNLILDLIQTPEVQRLRRIRQLGRHTVRVRLVERQRRDDVDGHRWSGWSERRSADSTVQSTVGDGSRPAGALRKELRDPTYRAFSPGPLPSIRHVPTPVQYGPMDPDV